MSIYSSYVTAQCVYQIALARMRCIMMRLHFRAVKTNTGMRVSGDDGMWGVTSRWSWLVWAASCSHGNRLVSWLLPCIWNTIIKIDTMPRALPKRRKIGGDVFVRLVNDERCMCLVCEWLRDTWDRRYAFRHIVLRRVLGMGGVVQQTKKESTYNL